MNFTYSFKHMEKSESVLEFSMDHVVRPLGKLLGEGLQLHLVFDSPQPDFTVDGLLTIQNGSQFKIKENGKNIYACIDAAGKKLVRMIRKEKNINTSYKHKTRIEDAFIEKKVEIDSEELMTISDKAEVYAS